MTALAWVAGRAPAQGAAMETETEGDGDEGGGGVSVEMDALDDVLDVSSALGLEVNMSVDSRTCVVVLRYIGLLVLA